MDLKTTYPSILRSTSREGCRRRQTWRDLLRSGDMRILSGTPTGTSGRRRGSTFDFGNSETGRERAYQTDAQTGTRNVIGYFRIDKDIWRVVSVEPGDPSLVDRTGVHRLATTDPDTRTISISSFVKPPLLDRVIVHEIAHAITVSHGLLMILRIGVPESLWIFVEEWAAQLVENHGIEAADIASELMGRPVCTGGYCHDAQNPNAVLSAL